MIASVLLVCRANLCRSPLAELMLAQASRTAGLAWQVDSAGTECLLPGLAPDPRVLALLPRGTVGEHRSRAVVAEDFTRFDLILAIDSRVMVALEELRPVMATATLGYLGDYDAEGERDIADPSSLVGDLPFRALQYHLQRCIAGLLKQQVGKG